MRLALITVPLLVICSCSQNQSNQRDGGNYQLEGYGGLTFGMSFEGAVSEVGIGRFNPISFRECVLSRVIRGCLLSPVDNLSTFVTMDGVPYTLGLSFNRLDMLTDISLHFDREAINGSEERISLKDCLSINDRTVDWVSRKYGPLETPRMIKKGAPSSHTVNGNSYWLEKVKIWNGFLASGSRSFDGDRQIGILSEYIVVDGTPSCSIVVSFEDSPTVERWKISPGDSK